MLRRAALGICLLVSVIWPVSAEEHEPSTVPRIAWYGTLESGLAEAERSGRPILLVSAAPQCLGVPGIW